MFSQCCKWTFFGLISVYLGLHGAAGFFVKNVNTGRCIFPTDELLFQGWRWGRIDYVELSNNCLDPAAQFRFHGINGAMLNLQRQGCVELLNIVPSHTHTELFFLFTHPGQPLDVGNACKDLPEPRYRGITQTSGGALAVRFKKLNKPTVQIWCATPVSNATLAAKGIYHYIRGTTPCDDAPDKRFHFGSVTCHGNTTKNVNCPKGQHMVVKTASYRGLLDTKTCGSSDNYTCQVDVTCRVKELCDGQHECNITVDDNLFPGDLCQGMKRYLYFEYQCANNTTEHLEDLCVIILDAFLSNSSLPNEGVVQIITNNGTKSVCGKSLENVNTRNTVCRHLGYGHEVSLDKRSPMVATHAFFSGSINCNSGTEDLSRCLLVPSTGTCSELSYIKCHICVRPLLQNKERIPDASFTASASSQDHNASDARISSGSSWCAPASDGKHYLQVDFARLYLVDVIAIFGDGTSAKWVTSYSLNYTTDLMKWNQVQINGQTTFDGPKNASNYAAIQNFTGITTKALRFIPIAYDVQPCMRIEICGATLLPDKPRHLVVTKIKSRSVEISWLDPENEAAKPVNQFRIELTKDGALIQNNTIGAVDRQKIDHLNPVTTYKVSVAAGNAHGFGEENVTTFTTSEDAPEGPPLNIKITAENTSSLLVRWEPPEEDKQNGRIVSYTVCLSYSDNKHCSKNYTTKEQQYNIINLNPSTKYYIRVLASTKVGPGNYSQSEVKITNGNPPKMAKNGTNTTLTFPLQIPSLNYTHFYVVAFKLIDGRTPNNSDSYSNNDLVTYAEAKKSFNPQPYIAAVVPSSGMDEDLQFVLGDGRRTRHPNTRRRRSTISDYYNGPLEPDTSYKIFQRIFINKNESYSTGWSPPSQTKPTTTPEPRTTTQPRTTTKPKITTKPITTSKPGTTREQVGPGGDGDRSSSSSNIGAIVGAVAGVCVLLILVVLAIIIIRRRRNKQYSEPGYSKEMKLKEVDKPPSIPSNMNDAFHLASSVALDDENGDPVEENKYDFVEDENIYGNEQSIAARIHNPIPVDEFSDRVNKLRQEDNKEFKLDYEDLPTGRTANWDISKRPYNHPKNRYGNAITYNHSRVILSGNEKTDYINATFMDGWKEKYYIATQGPKPNTVNDFWRMIFEHKCPTIVMLTSLKEMGKVKCEKYWPDESHIYGEIKVTATETRTFADYVTRTFTLEKDDEYHAVQQFHFKSWPDHGVPSYPTQILTFRSHFKSFHETRTGPAVVHCSAGVGRTGVFIAVDKILDDLDKEKKDTIDIFGFVKDMRTRRVNMVQTSDQYVFIHNAVVDHIKCGANEVDATQVNIEIKHLSKKNKKGKTGFEEKFQRLNTVSPELVKEQCEAALLEDNRKKNRNPEIYPSESARAHLKYLDDVTNSDYINACYVDGYLGKNYFIATQAPLQETINDFWRMVLQHNSSTIVMLNQLREGNEEYPMFWPTHRAKPQPFGPTTVMLDSFTKKDTVVIRKFIISPSPDLKDGRMVQMIQFLTWPDHGVPENVRGILKILSEVEDSQRAAEIKGRVIVMCSDGAGRSGTYIAISNLVERVKIAQVIDVFQCIKLIRSKRPQFVETAAQFKLCYDAVLSYLDLFNEYSNFADI